MTIVAFRTATSQKTLPTSRRECSACDNARLISGYVHLDHYRFRSCSRRLNVQSPVPDLRRRGARSKLVGMGPPPINLLFHDFLTSPFRRFLGRVDVLNHFQPVLSVCCPLWAYLVLFHDYGVKVIVAIKIIII